MALTIRSSLISFDVPGTKEVSFDFRNTIKDYGASLKGFNMEFAGGEDRNVQSLGAEIIDTYLNEDRTVLSVKVKLTLNDDSGHYGTGDIDVVAFADIGGK